MKGKLKISELLGSTVAGFGFILVLIFKLQNRIKLGSEVGFAYQSPPPWYFIKAISCEKQEKLRSSNAKYIFFMDEKV
jgi:hypothetical protein